MKKSAILILLFLLILPLFADNETQMEELTSQSIEITAYKNRIDNQIKPQFQIRFLDSDSVDFSETLNAQINIPLHARYSSNVSSYKAFSWNLSGNIFGEVVFSITFGAMYWRDNSGNPSEPIIPYSVELRHTSSRIGNTEIPVGRQSETLSSVVFNGYEFKYADNVSITNNNVIVDSNNRSRTINIAYSMQTYTVCSCTDPEVSTSPKVCDSWNRSGGAYFILGIDASGNMINLNNGSTITGTTINDGAYYADVTVLITKND